MRQKTKSTLKFIGSAVLSWTVAAITGVLGLAPPDIFTRIFGQARISSAVTWAEALSTETLRWCFVILSYLTFSLGVTFLLGIPLWRLRARIKDFGDLLERDAANDISFLAQAKVYHRQAEKKGKRARALHNKARLMLEEIRSRKAADRPPINPRD
jgi:hypothetical protein